MNKINVFALAGLIALLSSASLHATGALSVTITPSDAQVIAVDGQVNLGCSPSGGCEPYSFSWSIPGASGSPPTTSQNPGSVAFGSAAEGKVNTVSVTVTDANNDTAVASVQVGVPKFDTPDDIWFFDDGQGDSTYCIERDCVVKGVPSGKTVTWKIVGQNDAIKFNNGQQQIVGTDTTHRLKSIGWSSTENNLTLELLYNGGIVAASDAFTARAPTTTTESTGPSTGYRYNDHGTPITDWGYLRSFTYTVTDKFGMQLEGLKVFEVFQSPATWHKLYPGCNWPDHTNYNPHWKLLENSQFVDTFGWSTPLNSGYIPTTVAPGDIGASQQVEGNHQTYKAGGDGTQGFNATGFIFFEDTIILCRGTAHR